MSDTKHTDPECTGEVEVDPDAVKYTLVDDVFYMEDDRTVLRFCGVDTDISLPSGEARKLAAALLGPADKGWADATDPGPEALARANAHRDAAVGRGRVVEGQLAERVDAVRQLVDERAESIKALEDAGCGEPETITDGIRLLADRVIAAERERDDAVSRSCQLCEVETLEWHARKAYDEGVEVRGPDGLKAIAWVLHEETDLADRLARAQAIIEDLRVDVGGFAGEVRKQLDRIQAMLVAKNEACGDSALNPVRVFSRAPTVEQLKVRIDDKLSRMARGSGEETEDVELDLVGYLVLLMVARAR